MSFARDFHICTCGHERRDHSDNYPRSRCLANTECKCQQFIRRTKRALDGACTCSYQVGGDDMSIDTDCQVHGTPRR